MRWIFTCRRYAKWVCTVLIGINYTKCTAVPVAVVMTTIMVMMTVFVVVLLLMVSVPVAVMGVSGVIMCSACKVTVSRTKTP